jgi:hypothetical protein
MKESLNAKIVSLSLRKDFRSFEIILDIRRKGSVGSYRILIVPEKLCEYIRGIMGVCECDYWDEIRGKIIRITVDFTEPDSDVILGHALNEIWFNLKTGKFLKENENAKI